MGTTKAVSLHCLVHITVIAAPQDVKVMSLRDKVEKQENVSLDGGHNLTVQKNAKKPTSKVAHRARWAEFLKSKCERNFKSMSGVIGNLHRHNHTNNEACRHLVVGYLLFPEATSDN